MLVQILLLYQCMWKYHIYILYKPEVVRIFVCFRCLYCIFVDVFWLGRLWTPKKRGCWLAIKAEFFGRTFFLLSKGARIRSADLQAKVCAF